MRFIADAMLGKLAKWLRILGYDTVYYSGGDDEGIVLVAAAEDRLILTRDTRLVKRLARDRHLFIRDNDSMAQLAQVVSELGLDAPGEGFLTRCTVCNGALDSVDKAEVRGLVPEYTFSDANVFLRCPSCGRLYWEGTHKVRILARLDAAGIKGGTR